MSGSIRWRLPFTYAGIAVLATLCLGAALLVTLRGYYADRERLHLENNAIAISDSVMQLQAANKTSDDIAAQLLNLAFITQARVKILNPEGVTIVDTGSPPNGLTLGYAMPPEMGGTGGTVRVDEDNQTARISAPFIQIGAADFAASEIQHTVPAEPMGTNTTATIRSVMPEQVFATSGMTRADSFSGGSAATFGQSWVSSAQSAPPMDTQIYSSGVGAGGQDMLVASPSAAVFFAISSTPYGFDLVGEVTPGVFSDQVVRLPLTGRTGNLSGYVELSEGMSFGNQIVENVAVALLFAGSAAILIAGLVGWFISRSISQPVMELTRGAARMAEGDLSVRVDVPGRDEFSVMARTFNDMAAQVETTIQTLRRFVADAAHELHTPLTALYADLELAATDTDENRRYEYIARARAQVSRFNHLTDNLLDLSRIESKTRQSAPQSVDLVKMTHELSEAYASRAEQVNVQFAVDVPDAPVRVMGDESQYRRVIGNLLDNAIKFTPDDGLVHMSVRQVGKCAEIEVNDSGIGIPPEDLPHLFNRFHRGRNANEYPGSGLGLAITKAILDGHHGQINVQSMRGKTRFIVTLPVLL